MMKAHVQILLAVVMVFLTLLALATSWVQPRWADAEARLAGVQFARSEKAIWFFDPKGGDIWVYDEARKMPIWHFKLHELGTPLETVSLTGKSIAELQKAAGTNPAQGGTTGH